MHQNIEIEKNILFFFGRAARKDSQIQMMGVKKLFSSRWD